MRSKERLTTEQQQAIEEAAKRINDFLKSKAFAQAIERRKRVATEEYGVQFNEVDNTPFREAVAPLHDEFKNHPDFQTLYRMIQEEGCNR